MSPMTCANAQPFIVGRAAGPAPRRRPPSPATGAIPPLRPGGGSRWRSGPLEAIAPAPVPNRSDAEVRAEEAILAGDDSDGTIAGFTKLEWSCIQTPARYLGNEIGAMHKDWDSAEVRFTMA